MSADALKDRLYFDKGITWGPYIALMIHSFATICYFVFVSATTAYLLVSKYRIPMDNMGQTMGQLTLADEIASVIFMFFWALVSDRFGRRAVLAVGYVLAALGIFLMPVGNKWDEHLLAGRVIFAIGSSSMSGVMAAMLGEVVTPKGAPRASALMGLSSGFGALVSGYGFLEFAAAVCLTTVYYVMGTLLLLFGVVVVCLYRNVNVESRPESTYDMIVGFKHVPKHIKDNPNLGLALLSSFPARSASVVASQFLTSWFIKVMCPYDDSDLDLPEIGVRCMFYDSRCSSAVSSASKVSGVIQGVAIGFSIVYGILNEKLPNARYGFMVAAFIGALSYSTVAAIDDPRDEGLYVSAVFMGMSQISMVMASQIFLVRQLPKEHLGTLSGVFSVFGGLGVIMVGVGGGELFDEKKYQAPFVMTGISFAVAFVLSVIFTILFPYKDFTEERENAVRGIPVPEHKVLAVNDAEAK